MFERGSLGLFTGCCCSSFKENKMSSTCFKAMLKSFSYNLGDSRGRTNDLGVLNNSAGVVAGIPDKVQVFRGSFTETTEHL